MKIKLSGIIASALFYFLWVCTASAQKNEDKIVFHYLKLSQALSRSDFNKASKQAASLASESASFSALKPGSDLIRNAKNLESIREGFSVFSDSLKTAVEKGQFVPGEALFVVHCPMAFNDKGADWISDQKKVINPYFGDEMLHCGSVKGNLKSSKK